ncbi:DNA-binding protein [Trueperella pyogenes TP8]|nr:DNA-binding protein [Trueperella pyogenes TP8]
MRDERTVGHPMKNDILQMPRDTFPAHTGISDNEVESRENAGAEIRGSAASSTSEASDLADGLMDVPQVADYLRVSKTSVYKLIERQKIPAIRIGRLLRVRKDELDEMLHAMGNNT